MCHADVSGKGEKMKYKKIVGKNYVGNYTETRIACRGIVISDGRLLLSYETERDFFMLPGGGLEKGETEAECCIREVSEETGNVITVSPCVLEIDEYYVDQRFITFYFFGTVTGQTEKHLTAEEALFGLKPVYIPVEEAVSIFSKYDECDGNKGRYGSYLREYTALITALEELGEKSITHD